MRNMKLRLISAALATCMMTSVLPASAVTAFAEDENNSVVASEEDTMGTLIPNNKGSVYEINTPGTYQMHGTYDAPIDVYCSGVTINITNDVEYVGTFQKYSYSNYAIRVRNGGELTLNNDGHTFTVKGSGDRGGILYCNLYKGSPNTSVTVKGGFYRTEDVVLGKTLFYNYNGKMTLDDIHVTGEMLIRNNEGTTTVNGGTFTRTHRTVDAEYQQGAINNVMDGTLTLNDVQISAEVGSALVNMGGKTTVIGGSYTTKDPEYSAILAYTDVGQFTDDDGKIISDGVSKGPANIEIDGATVKDSNHGIEVKNTNTNLGKITLQDITFENNTSDIYLDGVQDVDKVIDKTNYSGKPLTAKVTDNNGNNTLCALKPVDLTVEGGTVKVDTSSIDEEATINKDGDTTKASIPVKALVTVTYDEAAYKDSNLKFNGWTIIGLANADDYKNQQTFTFEMPANTVTIKAGTATADTEDDSWDAATVVTGVAIGAGAAVLTYHIGTELYAEQVLGKGVAVPKTREDVALKAWELAGKPAVELNGEPLSEAAQAEKWAVESGLMQNDANGNFNGAKKMNKLKALRVLDSAKKLG